MTTPERSLEQLAADYARHRAAAVHAQERMSQVSATMTSPQGLVTVTVGAQGEVQSLLFNSQDYRKMPAAELSHVVLDTISRARASVMQQLAGALPDSTFAGISYADVMNGNVNWDQVLPEKLDLDGMPWHPGRPPGRH